MPLPHFGPLTLQMKDSSPAGPPHQILSLFSPSMIPLSLTHHNTNVIITTIIPQNTHVVNLLPSKRNTREIFYFLMMISLQTGKVDVPFLVIEQHIIII